MIIKLIGSKIKLTTLFFAISLLGVAPFGFSQSIDEPVNICETGPLVKQYGGAEWYVYSCTDMRSLVVVAAPNNPTSKPFAFSVSAEDGVIQLNGASEMNDTVLATFNSLKALKPVDIKSLVDDTIKFGTEAQ